MTGLLVTTAWSYLLGSVPFGYLLVRAFRGEDVRQTGSGNIGATNVSRTSPALGILTLLLDALKGCAAVFVTHFVFPDRPVLLSLAAFAAIVGHMFPVWLNFRGGKGVATGLGSFIVFVPKTVLIMMVCFIAVFLVFRYVSLASIVAVALFPLIAWTLHPYGREPRMLALMTASALLIIAKHHENIRRLLAGTEPRWEQK